MGSVVGGSRGGVGCVGWGWGGGGGGGGGLGIGFSSVLALFEIYLLVIRALELIAKSCYIPYKQLIS